MPDIEISNSGVKKLLDNLKPRKASSPDSIPPVISKELSNEISSLLEMTSCTTQTDMLIMYFIELSHSYASEL